VSGGGLSRWPPYLEIRDTHLIGVKNSVDEGDTDTILPGYQLIVYGNFTNNGDLIIDGDLIIL
jgi:hypothetical protein